MTHPNLLFLPLYRLISFFTNCSLYYIRHNPTGFRHVANSLKNILIVLSDFIASTCFLIDFSFFQEMYWIVLSNHFIKINYIILDLELILLTNYRLNLVIPAQTFIFFGRCLPYKGLDILIEALNLINDRSLNFIIASNSIPMDYMNKLSKLKDKHNIDIFNEWLDDDSRLTSYLKSPAVQYSHTEQSLRAVLFLHLWDIIFL